MKPLILSITILLLSAAPVFAADYYISPSGSDSNPGTQSQPFASIQKAINSTTDGDIINVKSGTYDLNGASIEFSHALTIVGEDKNTTIFTDGNPIVFHNSLTVKNLSFKNWRHDDYDDTIFRPEYGYTKQYGNYKGTYPDIDGITFDNLIIEDAPSFIRSLWSLGYISNVTITNNLINNIHNDWSTNAIAFMRGHISNFTIAGNTMSNISTTNENADTLAIVIGNDTDYQSDPPLLAEHILIENNSITNLRGGWVYDPNSYYPGSRGIMLYGQYMTVRGNHISEIQEGATECAMNCIYLKSNFSTIENNVLHNCGTNSGGSAALTIKGVNNLGNTIRGNIVTSDQLTAGPAIVSKGEVYIENNYIDFTHSIIHSAIIAYDLSGDNFYINNNQIRYNNSHAIYIGQASQGEIAHNTLVSNDTSQIYLSNSSNLNIHDNFTCQGYDDCFFSPPPTTSPTPTPQLSCGDPCTSPDECFTIDPENPYIYWCYQNTCVREDCIGRDCTCTPPPDCPTDINQDGITDITDFSILSQNFFSTNPSNPRADISQDGIVDLSDFSLLSQNFLQVCQ